MFVATLTDRKTGSLSVSSWTRFYELLRLLAMTWSAS